MKVPLCLLAVLLAVLPRPVLGQSRARGANPLTRSILGSSPPGMPCSPAPCVLPPTMASEGTATNISAPVAASPTNPTQLIVGSKDGNCGRYNQVGFHVSRNAGSTWKTTCLPFFTEFGRRWAPGDWPVVGYDLNGTAYIAGYYQDTEGLGYSLMGIETSKDGLNWSRPTAALGNGGSVIWWPALSVDQSTSSPYTNSVYLSGVNLNGNQIVVSHSRDSGGTWTQELVGMDPSAIEYDTSVAVGKDGTVYVAWMHCPPGGYGIYCPNALAYVAFSQSSDGGVSWSEPRTIAKVPEVPDGCMCWPFGGIPNTNSGAPNTPVLAVDNSGGTYSGRLYITMFAWTGTHMRVEVSHSTDGGNTWSEPVAVAPHYETHDEFFSWISVSPTGLAGVSWFDRRNDPANISYQAYAAISSDGGESFQPNVRLTSAFSNPDNSGFDDVLGYYAGNTWDGPNYFVAAWMDTSNGVSSQDFVGGIRLK